MGAPALQDLQREIRARLQTLFHGLTFDHCFSDLSLNLGPSEGSQNWKLLETFQSQLRSLNLDFTGLEPESKICGFSKTFLWMFQNMRLMHHFPPRFFRQSEALFLLVSIIAERMKLLTLFQSHLREDALSGRVRTLPAEVTLKAHETCSSGHWLLLLTQQILLERSMLDSIFEKADSRARETVFQHQQIQLGALQQLIRKIEGLKPAEIQPHSSLFPKLHFSENLPEFQAALEEHPKGLSL